MLISMSQKSSSEGLLIDPNLAKQLIQSVVDINEKMSAENKTSVVVTSPLIRRGHFNFIKATY